MPRDISLPPSDLCNLGPRTQAMLARAGIRSVAELRKAGAVGAYLRLKRAWPQASRNALYALAAALEGRDWREIARSRKLELLTAVEDVERAHPPRRKNANATDDLLALRNIGPAMRADFARLGVRNAAHLATLDADRLYLKLARLTGTRHDLCVWDTFAAAIHQARSGEALPWWHFTRERKRRQAQGSFLPGGHR